MKLPFSSGVVVCFAAMAALACGSASAQNDRPGPLIFGVVSDIHCESGNLKAQAKFRNALRDARGLGARVLVVAGDIADGQARDYRKVHSITDASPMAGSVYFAMGNHEYYGAFHDQSGAWNPAFFPNNQTDQAAKERFNSFRGVAPKSPVYYDEWIGGFHFIFLAGEFSRMTQDGYKDDAVLSPEQLSWLKASLEKTRPDEPVFVFLHQPFPGTVAGSYDGAASIKQSGELNSLLAAHPAAIMFSGHSHRALAMPGTFYTDASRKFAMFNCSSVWQPCGADDKPLEVDASEGFIVYAGEDGVVVRGRDFKNAKFMENQTYNIRSGPDNNPRKSRTAPVPADD